MSYIGIIRSNGNRFILPEDSVGFCFVNGKMSALSSQEVEVVVSEVVSVHLLSGAFDQQIDWLRGGDGKDK